MDANVECDYERGVTMWSFLCYYLVVVEKCINIVTIEGNIYNSL